MAKVVEEKPGETHGERDRARELARRKAQAEQAKKDVSIIVHGPVQK